MKFSLKMLYPVQASTGRCASDNLTRDDENLLLVAAFYTPISSFWEGPLQNSVPLSNFSTHLYQIISSLWDSTFFLDVKVNTLQFWSLDGIQIFTVDLVSDLLIGWHLIPLFRRNCLWVFTVRINILWRDPNSFSTLSLT